MLDLLDPKVIEEGELLVFGVCDVGEPEFDASLAFQGLDILRNQVLLLLPIGLPAIEIIG